VDTVDTRFILGVLVVLLGIYFKSNIIEVVGLIVAISPVLPWPIGPKRP